MDVELTKKARALETSEDKELMSIGYQDGSISVYHTKYLAQNKFYDYIDYKQHEAAIIALLFIGKPSITIKEKVEQLSMSVKQYKQELIQQIEEENDQRVVSLDYQGKLVIFCLKDQTALLQMNAPQIWNHAQGHIVYDQIRQRLFLINGENNPIEEFNLQINAKVIQESIKSNLRENINKRFLEENDTLKLQTMMKFVKSDPKFLAQKVNLCTMAILYENKKAFKILDQKHEIQTSLEGQTLIQKCLDNDNIDMFDECIAYMIDSTNLYLDQHIVSKIISSEPTASSKEFLRENIILEARFVDKARKLLPLFGVIKQQYILTDDQLLTPEDLKRVYKLDKDEGNKINIYTCCTKMSLEIGDKECRRVLKEYQTASDDHLNIKQVSMYVEALWNTNWSLIHVYYFNFLLQFALLCINVLFFPEDILFYQMNGLVAFGFCLNEVRQIFNEGFEGYFHDFATFTDNLRGWVGNIFVIVAVVKILCFDDPVDFYKKNEHRGWLIIGILSLGWNSINTLTIYNQFRVEVALIRQTLVDIKYFMIIMFWLLFLAAMAFSIEHAMDKYIPSHFIKVPTGEQKEKRSLESLKENFWYNYFGFYLFILGDTDDLYGDDPSFTVPNSLTRIVLTLLVQVVALNLFISIIADTYANVKASMQASNCRTMVDLLLEISHIRENYIKYISKVKSKKMWLHFVHYANEKIIERDDGDLDDKVKDIHKQVNHLKVTHDGMNEQILDMKQEVQEQLARQDQTLAEQDKVLQDQDEQLNKMSNSIEMMLQIMNSQQQPREEDDN